MAHRTFLHCIHQEDYALSECLLFGLAFVSTNPLNPLLLRSFALWFSIHKQMAQLIGFCVDSFRIFDLACSAQSCAYFWKEDNLSDSIWGQ